MLEGNASGLLLKLAEDGSIQWQKTYAAGYFYSVQQTSDGGYITGGTGAAGGPYWSGRVLKLDSEGNIQWQKFYGYASGYGIKSVQQTADGGYILTGDLLPAGGIWVLPKGIWICKLNSKGDIEWQNFYSGNESNSVLSSSIKQTNDGGYIVIGFNNFSSGKRASLVFKLDPTGNIEWQNTYVSANGFGYYNYAISVQATKDDGYVIGNHLSVLKLDNKGNIEWSKKMVEPSYYAFGYSTIQAEDGGYVVASSTYGANARSRIMVSKLDNTGNLSGCPAAAMADDNINELNTNLVVSSANNVGRDVIGTP